MTKIRASANFDYEEIHRILTDGDVYRFFADGTDYEGNPEKARNALRAGLSGQMAKGRLPEAKFKTKVYKDLGGYVDVWYLV